MNKRKILFIPIITLVIIAIIIATHILSIKYYLFYGQYDEDAKRVYRVPEESYISIKNLKEDTNDKLRWVFDHGVISFFDSDSMVIYRASSNNNWFIVRYKDEYYINAFMYDDLIITANIIAEQRNRIYNLGDIVILRSDYDIPYDYAIKIDTVQTDTLDETKHIIKFTTSFDIPEHKRKQIFNHIETDKGTIINDFTFINEKTVQVQLAQNEKINMIIVKSPDYKNYIRKISIE